MKCYLKTRVVYVSSEDDGLNHHLLNQAMWILSYMKKRRPRVH